MFPLKSFLLLSLLIGGSLEVDTTTTPARAETTTTPVAATTIQAAQTTTQAAQTTTQAAATTTTVARETTTQEPEIFCPLGWVEGGHIGCFLFSTETTGLSWIEALEFCEEEGGFLAEPKTIEQLQFIASIAYVEESFTGVQGWWVGLSDLGHEGHWVWQFSREETNIMAWDENCPDMSLHNSRDCAALVSISVERVDYPTHYRDLTCADNQHDITIVPICQRGGLEEEVTPTPTPECPSGWQTYQTSGKRKCFKHFTTFTDAKTAENNCNKEGAHLASVHTDEEQTFLVDNYYHGYDSWIGGVDLNLDGHWEWMDGTTFDFSFWMSGQPDGGQGYIYMDGHNGDYSDWQWRDNGYSVDAHYICQIEY